MSDGGPRISVVVPSHDRPVRLRFLLNALAEQTLPREQFEVIVAHDSAGPETDALLDGHPLRPRTLRFAPGPGPAAKRNAGWAAARAPFVAFTDDDCRPPAEWLERALAAARDGAIVQGTTRPDPDERGLLYSAAHVHTQVIDPPDPWAQTCNIVYPRAVLEAAGGFDEALPVAAGEDTDLALRAQAAGVRYEAAPDVLTFHAVDPVGLRTAARAAWRWRHLPYVARRHPGVRRHVTAHVFWKREHATALLAAAGLALAAARRRPAALALAAPYVHDRRPSYGSTPRGLARSLVELPGRLALDLVETAGLAVGSARHRTLFL